jgi:hypothetical protein
MDDDAISDEKSCPAGNGDRPASPALLEDRRHYRADARTALRLLACGTLTEQQVEGIVRAAGSLAAKAAVEGRTREYAAATSILCKVAELGLKSRQLDLRERCAGIPSQHLHLHQAPVDERLAEISAKLGIPLPPSSAAMNDVYRSLGLVPPPSLE